MRVVGIDPGTHTGFALWNSETRVLERVESMQIHRAMEQVSFLYHGGGTLIGQPLLVIFEDAHTIRMSSKGKTYGQTSRLQGVGSVKRDSSIWRDFLEDHGIPYFGRTYKAGLTKLNAEEFKRLTGWMQSTNDHGRDAACIVQGLNLPMVKGHIQAWQQRHAYTSTPASARR